MVDFSLKDGDFFFLKEGDFFVILGLKSPSPIFFPLLLIKWAFHIDLCFLLFFFLILSSSYCDVLFVLAFAGLLQWILVFW